LWVRQERVFACKTQPQLIYLALIAVAAFFGVQNSSESLQYLALPLFAVGIYSLIFGTRAGFQLSLVVAIVLFALPIWSWLQPPLQTLASVSVAAIFDFIQTPVFLEGNRITVPAGIFEVQNGCSGLNYFLVANCTAYTASLWAELKGPKFVAQMAAATAFAIVVNWLRIGTIIYVGNTTDMQSSLVTDHVTFGWILFACLFVPYVFFVLPHSPSAMATKKGETL
jgi:exosortase